MQEATIQFLTEYRKYRVFCWSFGPTLLEDLCREKNFDITEFLAKKDKYQCAELLMAFGDRKKYWWWPWSKKFKDSVFDEKDCRRACEYHNYSWFWRIILGLFTPVLVHRQVLKWINIEYGGYMLYRSDNQKNVRSHATIVADLKTIGGALKLFGFSQPSADGKGEISLLQQLDDSLEMVNRNMKTAEQHRQFVSEIDKKMKNLSLEFHPDRVMNRGGSEKELAEADEKQAALTACRALIKNASEFFLDYIHIDFKYGCYNKMKINSLGTMNSLNIRFLTELSQISRTKQEEIITHTHRFLKTSRSSMEQFIISRSCEGNDSDWAQYMFEQHRNDALNHLTSCIAGHEKFHDQCEEVQEECRRNPELHALLYDSVFDMSYKNNQQLEHLYKLQEFAENALQGKIGIIDMREMDEYMTLPFAMYVGALSLCSNAPEGKKADGISCLMQALIRLLSCFFSPVYMHSVSISSSFLSMDIGKKGEDFNKVLINLASYLDVRKEINIYQFAEAIEIISDKLAEKFNLNNYRAITLTFYLEESRELAARIEVFTNKVAEDLAHAREILQDQDKIAKDFKEIAEDQVKIREGFVKVNKNLDKLSKDQDKTNERMQDLDANLDAILAAFAQPSAAQPQPSGSLPAQNPQQPPRSSLSNVEPSHHHSQSMGRN